MTTEPPTAIRCFIPMLAALIALCGVWPSVGARADDRATCLERAAARDFAGKMDFQNGLFELIAGGEQELQALAALNRELQLALAEARATQITYLSRVDPGRVDTQTSLAAFRNFDWTGADEASLSRDNEAYKELAGRIAELRQRSDGHPDWPRLRAFFGRELATSAGYRELTARLVENEGKVADIIKSCAPG